MATSYNGFSWDIAHERQYILDIHEAILRHSNIGNGIAVEELYAGRNPAAVHAALVYLFERGHNKARRPPTRVRWS